MGEIHTFMVPSSLNFNEKFIKLKRERKLSRTIVKLLQSYLGIESDDIAEDREKLQLDLERLDAERLLVAERLAEIEKQEREEREKIVRF